jgi:hypothetical protein
MNRRRIATASIKKTHSQCQRWGLAPIAGEPAKPLSSSLEKSRSGGAYRDRTDDLMLAKQPLSQLS